jgi:hypothetical protein
VAAARPVPFSEHAVVFELRDGRVSNKSNLMLLCPVALHRIKRVRIARLITLTLCSGFAWCSWRSCGGRRRGAASGNGRASSARRPAPAWPATGRPSQHRPSPARTGAAPAGYEAVGHSTVDTLGWVGTRDLRLRARGISFKFEMNILNAGWAAEFCILVL